MDRWPPDRIPDEIEPLVGYRAWMYVLGDRRAELHSLNCVPGLGRGACEWESARSNWVVASCAFFDEVASVYISINGKPGAFCHEVPGEDCACGFYAMSTLSRLVEEASPRCSLGGLVEGAYERGMVVGRVALAGKVIEHEHGSRAERARIVELIPIQGTEPSVTRLALRLGVPVGRSVPLHPKGPGPRSPASQMRGWYWVAAAVAWVFKVIMSADVGAMT